MEWVKIQGVWISAAHIPRQKNIETDKSGVDPLKSSILFHYKTILPGRYSPICYQCK